MYAPAGPSISRPSVLDIRTRLYPAVTGESSAVRATHAPPERTALLPPGGAEQRRRGEERKGAELSRTGSAAAGVSTHNGMRFAISAA